MEIKGVYTPKIKLLYTAFLHSIETSGYKAKIKFNKVSLAVEHNNYGINIVNAYIIYDLDNWPNNPFKNFTLKMCFFGATSIVQNSDKGK